MVNNQSLESIAEITASEEFSSSGQRRQVSRSRRYHLSSDSDVDIPILRVDRNQASRDSRIYYVEKENKSLPIAARSI